MPAPTGPTTGSRTCPRCGREARVADFFCRECTTRLPDPVGYRPVPRTPPARLRDPGRRAVVTLLATVVVVGAVVAAVVLAVVRLDLLAPDPTPPGAVVEAYVEAAAAGDCSLVARETESSPARCRAVTAALEGTELSAVRVEDVLEVDGVASVRVRMTLDERTYQRCTFQLALTDDVWRVSDAMCERATPVP